MMAPLVDLCESCFDDTIGRECPRCLVLFHHSVGPGWVFDPRRRYTHDAKVVTESFKPRGLWLSYPLGDSDTWADWMNSEDFGFDTWYRYPVIVNRERLLRVTELGNPPDEWMTPDHLKYGADDPDAHARRLWLGEDYPCWPKIVEHFAGFDNHRYEHGDSDRKYRGDAQWHYSWDCSSVVVWDLSAVVYVGGEQKCGRP